MTAEMDIICEVCGAGETGAPNALDGLCDDCAAVEPLVDETE